MKKGFVVVIITLMFVLAGCQSAFKLPAGCEEDTPVSGAEVAQSIDDYSVDAPISEVNKAETISLKDSAQSKYVPEKTVIEGDTVRLSPVVSDAEGDKIDVSFSGWMNSDSKKTDFGDAGIHVVTVKASDGTSAVSKKVNVVVQKVNRAPVIEQISDVVIKEGDKMTIKPVASDLDKDKLSFTFSQPLDANGVWQTKIGDV